MPISKDLRINKQARSEPPPNLYSDNFLKQDISAQEAFATLGEGLLKVPE